MKRLFETKYGYFKDNGKEYVIKRPDTPRPWVNAISNGDYGLVISQTGSGYSFRGNSNLCRINTWVQDVIKDDYGKYIYIRDNDSKAIWSLSWKPTCPKFIKYEVRHGMGYTVITSVINGIEAELLIFVPFNEPVEIWKVTLKNKTGKKRSLSLFTYFELCLGNPNGSHREYHKTFIGTEYDKSLGAMFADKRREVNRKISDKDLSEWPCSIFHSSSVKPKNCEGDKENFLGNYGTLERPKAVSENRLTGTTGRWSDPISSLQVEIDIPANSEKIVIFTLGETKDKDEAARIIKKYKSEAHADKALAEVKKMWDSLLSGLTIETPDPAMDLMVNTWLKYQAISCRLWARCAYYQSSGAFGFRDQLQDAQIFFYLKPSLAKKQILLHAAHQYYAGTVYHWWHTLTEWGLDAGFSDDLLWLAYVTLNYIDETDDYKILDEEAVYLDAPAEALYYHCVRAINKVLARFSKRGLPLIGEGDWNDGLSSVGVNWKGESIWLGHFLYGILERFAGICLKRGDKKSYNIFIKRRDMLKKAINRYAWDGKWYIRAISDNGKVLGSSKSKEGRIFFNAQSWSVITGSAEGKRGIIAMNSAEKYLDREYGPLLFYPAYSVPDPEIGYLTRYAAGTRENGGVYSHAATWAIMAECMLKRNNVAYNMYKKMIPPERGMDPDFYKGEPYAMPGNIDGPDSANFGRGSWTLYTGSAAWIFRVITEWILGVRPGKDGLVVDPCIPRSWKGFRMKRLFRGKMYEIEVKRDETGKLKTKVKRI
ncbi:MAG: glycosyl transferase family 36 [Candidatus Omnitrophica bacterium]|nr:glycosyl transferase family 36 [Candidatus Omnitrophota bacterium]MCG2704509.1 glycosyl transferase family 36 [Candidatus Omnitrophota bacterium]